MEWGWQASKFLSARIVGNRKEEKEWVWQGGFREVGRQGVKDG